MISTHDRILLRDLAERTAEIASLPIMEERKALWKAHNSLQPTRPMILVFPECGWGEILPYDSMQCEGEQARQIEYHFRVQIYTFEHFRSDNVVEGELVAHKFIRSTGWGLEPKRHDSPEARGAWAFDPVIKERSDLKKLCIPEISYDKEGTERHVEMLQDLFGDILEIKVKGVDHISFHLIAQYTYLRGLDNVMLDMYEAPDMLHEAMAFLEEGNRRVVEQYIEQNLLSLNNDNTYHSSGGNGYTDELPKPGFDPERVRPCDMWASAESQELAQVSPAMHAEFALACEKRLLEPFGLNGYGCCEDLTRKLDDVLTIPNIRRISISPWADVDVCAEKLSRKAIFSWKPNPAFLVGSFNEDKLRDYLRYTINAARNCALEIILKDTHTCQNHPERFDRWSQIARELVET